MPNLQKTSIIILISIMMTSAITYGRNIMDGTGLQTAVVVDNYFKSGNINGRSDHLEIREAEVLLQAPIDYLFDGRLSLAAHPESTGTLFEVHEAYISSSKLIPRVRFRVGQFFLGIGRLNQTHRHDWRFISAPKVHETFFNWEAVLDSGAEAHILMPTSFYWDLTVGVTNGWFFGHSHSIGQKPKVPVHYIRSAHFFKLPYSEGVAGVNVGFNYLGRTDAAGTSFQYLGLDGIAKWRQGQSVKYLLQSEAWTRTQTPDGATSETLFGAYIYPEMRLFKRLCFGIRGDILVNMSLKDVSGNRVSNGTWNIVPTLVWRSSEFSKFSVSYNYEIYDPGNDPIQTRQGLEFLSTFTLGSHPAHNF